MILDSIPPSHYVEKVRWCLDRLGLDYEERPMMGILGVLLTGRTVPRLRLKTGRAWTSIGNSSDILRYLWGRYAAERGEAAAFLEPTPEALELEARLDAYGHLLQAWVYQHMLDHKPATLRAWGGDDPRIPAWQKWAVRLGYPLVCVFMRKVFRLSAAAHPRRVEKIEAVLADMEALLQANGDTLLGTPAPTFVDITLASLSALWAVPVGYGGRVAGYIHIDDPGVPPTLRAERERWAAAFPRVTAHVHRLYAEHRLA